MDSSISRDLSDQPQPETNNIQYDNGGTGKSNPVKRNILLHQYIFAPPQDYIKLGFSK
jgi:hypothetical protein